MKQDANYRVDGIYIRDRAGRVVLLRGCNLGGDSKIPSKPEGNPLSYDVSFTGRPFAEEEADAHFARLAGWGFSFVRLVITWEAVEHAGPGIYDEDYLAYLRAILKRAEAHGISVYVDPHQDAWSRWTGGDGAPGWTLEAIGFDLSRIAECGAAFTMASEGDAYRPMSWGLNYLRYANATMWTLFFGGNTFAPGRRIEGVSAQDWLQDHFIDAMRHTARRLKDCASIVGFGTLNEPHCGYIGLSSLKKHHRITAISGSVPTAFESMKAASGFPSAVKNVSLGGGIVWPWKKALNPEALSLFKDGELCPWREAGVWAIENGTPVVKRDDWFMRRPEWASNGALRARDSGCDVFSEYFLKPFQKRFMEAVSKKHERYLFFVEGVPHGSRASWPPEDRLRLDGTPLSIVEAFHWYDGLTLLSKRWRSWLIVDSESSVPNLGPGASARSARKQLARLAKRPRLEGIPALLGEFGVPFDLSRGKSFRTGDYSAQEAALGTYYDAIDAALLPSTVWNYSATNTHGVGDGWNTEDLSIYSATTGEGRAVRGFSRPYAMAIAGKPVEMEFDRRRRIFTLTWDASGIATGGECVGEDPAAEAGADANGCLTEIFVPAHWYPEGWRSRFLGGDAELEERPDANRLFVTVKDAGRATVRVIPLGAEA